MSQELLQEFRSAYANLELFPLLNQKEMERFKVEYEEDTIDDLQQLVEDDPESDGKIVFTGHRGCGKSTLLAGLRQKLEKDYFVVFFSIADAIEMSAVNHVNILMAIAINLMSEAEAKKVSINPTIKKGVEDWFTSRTRVIEKNTQGEVEVGLDIFSVLKAKLKTDATVRDEIKKEFERKISDLVAQINLIAAEIQGTIKKPILVIIDDLDKLDLARVNEIYRDNIKALLLPNFSIIYTIPIAIIRDTFLQSLIDTETDGQRVVMPVVKIFSKGDSRLENAHPRAKAKAILCDILTKRIPPELIEPETIDKIVIQSGVVLREMIRIARECCRICLRNIRRNPTEKIIIDEKVFLQAINKLRNDFTISLGKVELDILQTTYQYFIPDDPKQQEFLDLLHGLFVLEYRNYDTWYDIHPILVETLKNKGLIG